jgi:hypothetical protein
MTQSREAAKITLRAKNGRTTFWTSKTILNIEDVEGMVDDRDKSDGRLVEAC